MKWLEYNLKENKIPEVIMLQQIDELIQLSGFGSCPINFVTFVLIRGGGISHCINSSSEKTTAMSYEYWVLVELFETS